MYNVNHKKRKLVHHTNIFKKEVVVLKPVKVNNDISNRELLKTILKSINSLQEQLVDIDNLKETISAQQAEINEMKILMNQQYELLKSKNERPTYFG